MKIQLDGTRKGNDRYVQLEEEIKGIVADAKNLAIGPTKEQWWLLLYKNCININAEER